MSPSYFCWRSNEKRYLGIYALCVLHWIYENIERANVTLKNSSFRCLRCSMCQPTMRVYSSATDRVVVTDRQPWRTAQMPSMLHASVWQSWAKISSSTITHRTVTHRNIITNTALNQQLNHRPQDCDTQKHNHKHSIKSTAQPSPTGLWHTER